MRASPVPPQAEADGKALFKNELSIATDAKAAIEQKRTAIRGQFKGRRMTVRIAGVNAVAGAWNPGAEGRLSDAEAKAAAKEASTMSAVTSSAITSASSRASADGGRASGSPGDGFSFRPSGGGAKHASLEDASAAKPPKSPKPPAAKPSSSSAAAATGGVADGRRPSCGPPGMSRPNPAYIEKLRNKAKE